ncbi:MAG TPA: hypothetical protein VG389_26935 [Myxococcota bacterium]|jgi:hypothetical protein|nr:hypothetical protein [Myxococcota bacterium]
MRLHASRLAVGAAACAACCAWLLLADAAPAAAVEIDCDVLCIWATNSETGIDSALADIPELKKPPFAGYKGYKLIANPKLHLKEGETGTAPLTPDHKLELTFKGLAGDKLSLRAVVPPKKLDTTLAAPSGKRFFLAGLAHKDGVLLLGISCARSATVPPPVAPVAPK